MQLSPSCSLIKRDQIDLLRIDNSLARAELSLFGGQLLSFVPKHDKRERIWMSQSAILDGKQAIRGGVPVCWPWFGDHPMKHTNTQAMPSHGYVRTQLWHLLESQDSDTGTRIVLAPQSAMGDGFDGEVALTLVINIGRQCSLELKTKNTGTESFNYRAALHTYFAVSNINHCSLQGLSGDYLDKTRGMNRFNTPETYVFSEETDRVHLCQPATVSIQDQGNQINVHSKGHDSIVVWNPWQDKSVAMKDMQNEGYLSMLCVETAVTQGLEVKAKEEHTLQQIID